MFVVWCVLCGVCCVLSVVCCALCFVCCFVFDVRWLMFVACESLTLCEVRCVLSAE